VVDTHCHLDACNSAAADLLDRARRAGLKHVATVGMNSDSISRSLEIARAHDDVATIIGRHPHETTGWRRADLDAIESAAADPSVRAIGETGLDYFRDRSPRGDQLRAFEAHVDLAERVGLPLVIHTREAIDDTLAVLRGVQTAVVMHCFSAPERLDERLERHNYISFAGNVTYPKATDLQATARRVPDDLLLVETDSPYLAPQPVRGKPNEPANIVMTAEHIARLRGISYPALERLVEANAQRVFRW